MELHKPHCTMIMRVSPKYPGPVEFTDDDERSLTSQYICLRTATAVGPDSDIVEPAECHPGRPCYKAT